MVTALAMGLGLLATALLLSAVSGWAEWNYKVQWNENPDAIESSQIQWHSIWDLEGFKGNAAPPRPR
jgi:hypothetical protein